VRFASAVCKTKKKEATGYGNEKSASNRQWKKRILFFCCRTVFAFCLVIAFRPFGVVSVPPSFFCFCLRPKAFCFPLDFLRLLFFYYAILG